MAATVLLLAAAAPPASAAFPGANGQLAVTPVSGRGVLIASPQTGRARRVCDAPQSCGARPAAPRFSPNGKEIVFAVAGSRLEIATASGVCLWCLSAPPLSRIRGTSPSFTPDGTAITFVHRGLWQLTLGSPTPQRLLAGPLGAPAWSRSGELAFVRRGWIWTGNLKSGLAKSLARVVRGSEPAWSPDARQLAFTRKGTVFITRIGRNRVTRIARGSGPAFSPDGRTLAFLAPNHRVTLSAVTGRRPRTRTVPRLRGRSLDWEPVTPGTAQSCAKTNGTVVARTSQATVRSSTDLTHNHIGWNGCLTALGIPFHLDGGLDGDGYNLTLGHVALAGDFAALQLVMTDKYMDYSDTVNVYDLRSGALVRSANVPCDGFPCDVTSLTINADGFAVWHAVDTPQPPEPNITAISCPSAGLCVAGDSRGDLLVSTAPSADRSAWTRVSPGTAGIPITGISCPTASLCVAVTSNGSVYSSSDPTAGIAAWHAVSLGAFTLQGVSCGSASLCVAVGFQHAYTTTDPTGPASAWSARQLSSIPDELDAVSCPSDALCVIADTASELLTSTDPADPATSWTPDHVSGVVTSVDCPTTGLCAAIGEGPGGGMLTTTDPAAGTWTAQPIQPLVFSVTCAGTSLCLALGGETAALSTDPTDASPSWSATTVGHQANAASCPAANLCIAVGGPDIITSASPTGGASAWNAALVDALPCDPCLDETLAAVDDHGARTLDSAPPGPGTVISDPRFTGDTVTWTRDGGAPESAMLN